MYTLPLTDDEAALLRISMEHFAKWNEAEADRLRGWANSDQPFYRERARQIRAVAERLQG